MTQPFNPLHAGPLYGWLSLLRFGRLGGMQFELRVGGGCLAIRRSVLYLWPLFTILIEFDIPAGARRT
jgi:hypothetical protein